MEPVAFAFAIACLFFAFLSLLGGGPAGIATTLSQKAELVAMWILGAIMFLAISIFVK